MAFLAFDDLTNHISNIIHEDTQQHPNHIDLTVSEIHRINGPGALDFGGSEFQEATTEKIEPEKQSPDDDYGWWKLQQGVYKVILNEKLDLVEGSSALISPHQHAREAGLMSNSFYLTSGANASKLSIHISVSEAGSNIKENARIAELRISEN